MPDRVGSISDPMRRGPNLAHPALHIDVVGVGPCIVFAHGFGGSARNFQPQIRALKSRFCCVSYDARGHGRSAAPEQTEAYDRQALVDDMHGVIERYARPNAILVGLSLGALTALHCAAQYPELVRGLVLASPPRATEARRRWAEQFADAIDREGLQSAGARFVWGAETRLDPAAKELVRRGFLEHRPHALAALLRNVLAEPASVETVAQIAHSAVPVLLIAGSEDSEAVASCNELAERIPHARVHIVDGAGHVVNLVNPSAFNAALFTFLDAIDAAPEGSTDARKQA